MLSIIVLSLFNVLVLLAPPRPIASLLELVPLPFTARTSILAMVIVNIVLSMAFEQWATQAIARAVGYIMEFRHNKRVKNGKMYKAVEGGMR